MARVFNGSNQYLRLDSSVVSAPPCTLSAWVRPTTINRDQMIFTLSWGTDSVRYDQLVILIFVNNKVGADTYLSTTRTRAESTDTVAANTWYFVCGTFSTSGGQYVWLDSTKSSNGGNSQSPANLNRTAIGVLPANNTHVLHFSGRVAYPAIWNTVLSDDDITSLGQKLNGVPCGVHPTRIRPESLVACWPLGGFDGDHDGDIWANAYNLTAYNSPTFDEGPAVMYSVPPQIIYPASAGGGGGGIANPALFNAHYQNQGWL